MAIKLEKPAGLIQRRNTSSPYFLNYRKYFASAI